ncbi:transposase [Streptomyces sp. NPDC050509]|uniref:transposase n=1 Tax=Streptomyces sp. NPDC050509 TaxID=3365620 RepID=UPI0037A35698
MIVLLDRGFATNTFLMAVAEADAAFLARLSAIRKPPVLARYDDGSFLSRFGAIEVRIIGCEITITTTTGQHTGLYRLATNLLDARRYPASDLVRLYHERWEVDSAYFEIKKSMLSRRVLRSKTWAGIAQEVYALLSTYQLLRIAMTDATETDPDRASFSIALQTARDQLVQAAGVIANTVINLVGAIGRTILDHLMPARHLRVSPRAVKRPLSRYAYKSLKVDRRTYKATLSIDILQPPLSP